MKRFAQNKRGFTLIELLIVIALLGALAIGLLATIDPFEQLKKGRDTSTRNTVAEIYNANLRIYATKGQFTWGTTTFEGQSLTAMGSDISALIQAGELKNRFIDLAGSNNLAKIFVTSTSPEHESVCFRPESKSFQADPVTIYDQTAGTTNIATCKSQPGGTADCYLCIQ